MDCRFLMLRYGWSSVAVAICCCGCSLVPRGHSETVSVKPATSSIANASVPQSSGAVSNPTGGPGATTSSAELTAVLDEIQQLGMLDPAAQSALVEELKKTDPSLWPQL